MEGIANAEVWYVCGESGRPALVFSWPTLFFASIYFIIALNHLWRLWWWWSASSHVVGVRIMQFGFRIHLCSLLFDVKCVCKTCIINCYRDRTRIKIVFANKSNGSSAPTRAEKNCMLSLCVGGMRGEWDARAKMCKKTKKKTKKRRPKGKKIVHCIAQEPKSKTTPCTHARISSS